MIGAAANGVEARQGVGSTEEALATLGSGGEFFATFVSVRTPVPWRGSL